MSHVYEGPLATYNSLTDKNLAGYFANTRMRRHLRKSGLVNKHGELVSENQYRLTMARKEHKKHVKNMLAQAIVHKTLDMERTRQVEIRRKLEEIAKIELVRRVRRENKCSNDKYLLPLLSPRAKWIPPPTPPPPPPVEEEEEEEKNSRDRKGDEDILPYLSPRSSRSLSRPGTAQEQRYRPQSAPSGKQYDDSNIIYVDERGRRLSPDGREDFRTSKRRPEEIDTKHLYALDSTALRKYALQLSRIEQESTSPYLQSPIPTPPRSQRQSRYGSRNLRVRPRTAETPRSTSSQKKSVMEQNSERDSERGSEKETPRGTPNGTTRRPLNRNRVVEGSLMLHRQEPAMMHQGEVQTLCEITMKYHGPNLTLPRDQYDPTQSIHIDQQHCGGNTLPVFTERLKPGDTFSFISRRHRGYPFSLSIFVDGRVDSRVSTCCEYRHAKGVKLGGKMGHFSLLKVEGATPCYKCKLNTQASPRSLKRPPKPKKPEQLKEEVIVVDRRQEIHEEVTEGDENVTIQVEDEPVHLEVKCQAYLDPEQPDENCASKQKKDKVEKEEKSEEDKYDDDFEEDEDKNKENGEHEDTTPREIRGEMCGDSEDEENKTKNVENHDEKVVCQNICHGVDETLDNVDGPDQTGKLGNKQVRFNEKVQNMGTPESSESKPDDNHDEIAKKEDMDVHKLDTNEDQLRDLLDHDDEGAVDTCDEVSEIETDLDSPRKQADGSSIKNKSRKAEKLKKNDSSESKTLIKEDEKKNLKSESEEDQYSDDFENSSDSTIKSDKEKKDSEKSLKSSVSDKQNKTNTEEKSKPQKTVWGEYYDEAFACDDKNNLHEESHNNLHENAQNASEVHDQRDSLNTPDTVSLKSLDDEKRYIVHEDSDSENMRKGPLQTTYEDMNIIGPLATLLVKVRRKRREMQSRESVGSESDVEKAQDNVDGKSNADTGFGSTSSLERERSKLGSNTSISSGLTENCPNGKKKLEPIQKEKKKRKKKISTSSSESGRGTSDSSDKMKSCYGSLNGSNRTIEQEMLEASQQVVQAVLESQKQMALSVQQVTQSSKLVINSSKEVLESSIQVNESSKQVNECSKQVNESSKQVVESSKQAIGSAMHAINSIQKAKSELESMVHSGVNGSGSVDDKKGILTDKSDDGTKENLNDNDYGSIEGTDGSLYREIVSPPMNEDLRQGPYSKKEMSDVDNYEKEELPEQNQKKNEQDYVNTEDSKNMSHKVFDETDNKVSSENNGSKAKSVVCEGVSETLSHNDIVQDISDLMPREDSVHEVDDFHFRSVVEMLDQIPNPDLIHDPIVKELNKSHFFNVEDTDVQSPCDYVHEIKDKEIFEILNHFDTEPEPDIPHEEQKELLEEFSFLTGKDVVDGEHDDSFIPKESDYIDFITYLEKEKMDKHDTTTSIPSAAEYIDFVTYLGFRRKSVCVNSSSIPNEAAYMDYLSYLDKKNSAGVNKKDGDGIKKLNFGDVLTCAEENEKSYMSVSPFQRRQSSPNEVKFTEGNILRFRQRAESMPVAINKKEVEKVVPKSFLYINKDDSVYSETVEIKIRETKVQTTPPDESKEKNVNQTSLTVDQQAVTGALPQEKVESSGSSVFSDSSILVHKSSEEDALAQSSASDEVGRNILNVSLDTSAEADIIVKEVMDKVESIKKESGINERNIMHETSSSVTKPITPRTDPDGQVTIDTVIESPFVEVNTVLYHGFTNTGQLDKDSVSLKSLSQEDEDQSFVPERKLRRQSGVFNLYEAIGDQEKNEINELAKTDVNVCDEDDLYSMTTSEEASLVVKRVVEGIKSDHNSSTKMTQIESVLGGESKSTTENTQINSITNEKLESTTEKTEIQALTDKNNPDTEHSVSRAVLHVGSIPASVTSSDVVDNVTENYDSNSDPHIQKQKCEKIQNAVILAGEISSIPISSKDMKEIIEDDITDKHYKGNDENLVTDGVVLAGEVSAAPTHIDVCNIIDGNTNNKDQSVEEEESELLQNSENEMNNGKLADLSPLRTSSPKNEDTDLKKTVPVIKETEICQHNLDKCVVVQEHSEENDDCPSTYTGSTPRDTGPIPIENNEDREIECPDVDLIPTKKELIHHVDNSTQQEKNTNSPRLVKSKSGAMVVVYPDSEHSLDIQKNEDIVEEELKQMTDKDNKISEKTSSETSGHRKTEETVQEINTLIEEEMKMTSQIQSKEIKKKVEESDYLLKDIEGPAITITEPSDSSKLSDELNEERNLEVGVVNERKKYENVNDCQNESYKNEQIVKPNLTEESSNHITYTENQESSSALSGSSSCESLDADVKFYENGEEVNVTNGEVIKNGSPSNLITIDGQVVDLGNLEDMDEETYKKVMSVAYNIDVLSTISEENTTSQSTNTVTVS